MICVCNCGAELQPGDRGYCGTECRDYGQSKPDARKRRLKNKDEPRW